jgi:prepilin-type N-terminal cleavage/methylation domain-containing protein
MRKQSGFTLIELLVVIAIIALLMSVLMPALQHVRKQSRTVACLTLLKQWGLWFSMYTEEYDGYFMQGFNGTSKGTGNNRWCEAMGEYHKYNSDVTCCPNATKPWFDEAGNPTGLEATFRGSTSAWGYWRREEWLKPLKGSYGINGWCNNPERGLHGNNTFEQNHWRTPSVNGAGYAPLFLDAQRYNLWPLPTDAPPIFDGDRWEGDNMRRVCLNRHEGFVNTLFLDFSARKVGLKELWALKWHRSYNTAGPWTLAGGVQPSDWPAWMKSFKDY